METSIRSPGVLNGSFLFKKRADGSVDRSIVICSLCSKEFCYNRSTSSLRYHLNARHSAGKSGLPVSTNPDYSANSQTGEAPVGQRLQQKAASNHEQTSSKPLSPHFSAIETPTTSTDHMPAKRKKRVVQILHCGQCKQPHPPKDPEGLVLWVQCDNCHKMFHTICVSAEIDLDDDQFWCFWCLDV